MTSRIIRPVPTEHIMKCDETFLLTTPRTIMSLPTIMADYASLKSAASSLCTDFASEKPPETLISHFSTANPPTAFEYGLPCLAPFVGHEFKGADEVTKYFQTLADQLSYRNMEFDEYVVDVQELKVSVKGRSRFVWTSTGEAWNEVFTYTLDFVEEGGVLKVRRYQVWADTGAAYLAREGTLKALCTNDRYCGSM